MNVTASFVGSPPNQLSVVKAGTGNGTVTSSPAAIVCGTACAASFAPGSIVTLTATPDSNSNFGGWAGACAVYELSSTCQVTMDAAKTAMATFTPKASPLFLTVSNAGGGSVASNPAGIACGTSCQMSVNAGLTVTLSATAASGYAFYGWSGACSGSLPTCSVTMDTAKSVTATFLRLLQ